MSTPPEKKNSWEQIAIWVGIPAALAGVFGITFADFVDKQALVEYVRTRGALAGLGLIVLAVVVWLWRKHWVGKGADRQTEIAPDAKMLAKVRNILVERYERRLGQKMADRQPVNLRILPSQTGTSKETAETYMTLVEKDVRAAIGDIFTQSNGRLLLVGLPGAGKTTLVLQLALHLLDRPGPGLAVVLNLATWRSEFKTLDEWLKQILPAELSATPVLSEQIRKNIPLVLLLDGLDELPYSDRTACLTAIGEFGADASRQFLISSRIAEYAATKDAPVYYQVEVEPLTVEQVEMGLTATANIQPESKRLLKAIQTDPLLRSAVENPFYLNTAQLLFSTGKNWSELAFVATDADGRQKELVEKFVEDALGRMVQRGYQTDKPLHWLSFFASRMTQRNMVVFELRDLQYDWWKWGRWQLGLGRLVAGLVAGLLFGLLFSPILGAISGLRRGLAFGLQFGPVFGLALAVVLGLGLGLSSRKPSIDTTGNVSWSLLVFYKQFRKNWIIYLGGSLGVAPTVGVGGGLAFGLTCGLCLGLIGLLEVQSDILQVTTPYHRFNASMRALYFSILQHKFLCYQLRKQGLLPPDLPAFLNEMSLRHIMEFDGDPATGTGGGTWRFRHRILQEYFAERWVEPEHPTTSKPT